MISIVDYGMGNLHSVAKAIEAAGQKASVVSSVREIADATHLVLPGVGNFGEAMKRLSQEGFDEVIQKHIEWQRPFLGICLGMQVLFESSEEAPGVAGLGIFKGSVRRFPSEVGRIPNIGWNTVGAASYYFVHSYYVDPEDESIVTGRATYGIEYPAMIASDNILAVQFHPEKSSAAGIDFLRGWINS